MNEYYIHVIKTRDELVEEVSHLRTKLQMMRDVLKSGFAERSPEYAVHLCQIILKEWEDWENGDNP